MSELTDELLFQLRAVGLPEPEREWRFHPARRWRLDAAWPDLMLCCEVEGGTWLKGGGRHNRAMGFRRDAEKYNEAALLGWTVLRFTAGMVRDGTALATVERAFEALAG